MVHSDALYRTWAWFEKNKRQVILAVGAAIVIGLIAYFITWQKAEKEAEAGRALSVAHAPQVTGAQEVVSPDPYLDVAKKHPGSPAAAHATYLAAAALFSQGKYDEALAEYQKFVRENPGSPFVSQATLGVGASFEAKGNIDQAMETYNSVIERYPNSPVLAQAKFSLARLKQSKGDLERALVLYEEVGRDQFGSMGNEAGMRAEEIKQKNPALAAKVQPKGPMFTAGTNAAGPAPGVKK